MNRGHWGHQNVCVRQENKDTHWENRQEGEDTVPEIIWCWDLSAVLRLSCLLFPSSVVILLWSHQHLFKDARPSLSLCQTYITPAKVRWENMSPIVKTVSLNLIKIPDSIVLWGKWAVGGGWRLLSFSKEKRSLGRMLKEGRKVIHPLPL